MQEGRRAQVIQTPASKKLLFGLAGAVVVIDQISKAWAIRALSNGHRIPIVGDNFDLRLVQNPGSAFGMFRGSTSAVFVLSLLITVFVIGWALRDRMASPILGLIIGGGVGNLIDRMIRQPGPGKGKVVDFIYLSFWPTFNLADASICIGVGLMILLAFRETRTAP